MLRLHVCLYHMRAWCRDQKRVWNALELTGAIDGCELLHGCWESTLGPSERQPVLITAEPSLRPDVTSLHTLVSFLITCGGCRCNYCSNYLLWDQSPQYSKFCIFKCFYCIFKMLLFYVYLCMCMPELWMCTLCAVPRKARRGQQIPWNWRYMRLWAD